MPSVQGLYQATQAFPVVLNKLDGTNLIGPPGLWNSSLTVTANRLYQIPLFIGAQGVAQAIGVNVSTLVASSNARLGIYANSVDNRPGALLVDAGQVSTASTGVREAVISQALGPNVWYWLAAVFSHAPAVASVNENNQCFGYSSAATPGVAVSFFRAFTFGALPADESAQAYTVSNAVGPLIWVR